MRKQAAKRKKTGDWRFNFTYASRRPRSYSVADDVHEAVKALAEKQGVSLSMLVEGALEDFLASQLATDTPE